jgi:hypothetical protein
MCRSRALPASRSPPDSVTRHYARMSDEHSDGKQAEQEVSDDAPECWRCHRAVRVSRGNYLTLEHMHYVFFHYEFEHDPTDVAEECGAGRCPSATVNPRPERRPENRL